MNLNSLIFRYGLYITAIIVGLPVLMYLFLGPVDTSYEGAEVLGYLSIILSLVIFIFLGVRRFREDFNEGRLNFMQALKVGVLITIIPSVGFGLYNHVYSEWLDPDFTERYFQQNLDKLETQLSPAEFQLKKTELEGQKEMFSNPLLSFVVMFLTVFLIGLVVTILVGLILRKEVSNIEVV